MLYSPKTADFFAGIGGIRLAFEKAGFKTAYALDNDKHCKKTYDLNFSSAPLVLSGIQEIESKDIPHFDVLLAGFPCQPFSIAGRKEGFKDIERGNAFFHMMDIVRARKPEVIFLENVKHLLTHDKRKTYSIIKQLLAEEGYFIKEEILNSAEYGNTPQNRERIYIVAFRSPDARDAFHFPGKVPLTKTAQDLLDKEVDEKYYYRNGWLYDRVKNGVVDQNYIYQWRRVYLRRGGRKGVCFTLTANMGMGGHNVPLLKDGNGIRRLTPRECCRIQGFKESFKLPDDIPDSQLYKQIGNSVTIPVVARIATNIKRALEKAHRVKKSTTHHGRHVFKTKAERDNVSNPRNGHPARRKSLQASSA